MIQRFTGSPENTLSINAAIKFIPAYSTTEANKLIAINFAKQGDI
jgi:hypothetical protein